MNKEKTLIFSLSAMLFLTASFLVYSWNEPVTEMPGTYSSPINTSGTAQTKTGELTVPIIYDSEGGRNYYLNPSGNSKISSITSDLSIQDIDSRDTKTLVTKEYLDFSLSELDQTITQTSNMFYVSGGVNPTCPEGTTLFEKKWLPRTCSEGIAFYTGSCSAGCMGFCSVTTTWTRDVETTPSCTINKGCCINYDGTFNYATSCVNSTNNIRPICYATNWEAVICVKNSYDDGTPLLANEKHSSKDCLDNDGEVVDIGNNLKICRFEGTTCPTTTSTIWRQYENWSVTTPGVCSVANYTSPDGETYKGIYNPIRYNYLPCKTPLPYHDWANLPVETYSHYYSNYGSASCGNETVDCYLVKPEYLTLPWSLFFDLTRASRTHVGCY